MTLRRFASAAQAFTECREAFKTLHRLAEADRAAVERQRDEELREMREMVRRLSEDRRRPRETRSCSSKRGAEVSLALGSAYFRNGQLEDAEREWKAAMAVNARFGEAHNNLAALYAMTGRKKDAEQAVRAAERAGFRVHPQLRDDIRRMEDDRVSLRGPAYRSVPAAAAR